MFESKSLNPIDTDTVKYFQDRHKSIPKSAYNVVPKTALGFKPTERLLALSKPKFYADNWVRKGITA
jgi:hypothetical protein